MYGRWLLLEMQELPVVGGTRVLLVPGGSIARVLTPTEFVTVMVSGLPSTITEQEVAAKLEEFGNISRVSIFHAAEPSNGSEACKQQLQSQQQQQQQQPHDQQVMTPVMGNHHQARLLVPCLSAWAKVMFSDPTGAEAAVAAADHLKPWGIKASRPAPVDSRFRQVGCIQQEALLRWWLGCKPTTRLCSTVVRIVSSQRF